MTEAKLKEELTRVYERLLRGETVEVGTFAVWEDYVYTRTKDGAGNPILERVVAMVFFDEDEGDNPAREDFDGTYESFVAALNAHQALAYYDDHDDEDEF